MKKVETEEWADPGLLNEIRKYGKFDTNACLNCGGCTLTCALASTVISLSPRASLQYVRAGLRNRLLRSLDPWLCYYCGECSTSCPRQAEPGETMMTLRRWLTGEYDWTKLSCLLFRSLTLVIITMVLVAFGVIAFSFIRNFDLEIIMHAGHKFEMLAIAAVLGVILLPNIIRMWWFTIMKPGIKVPIINYIKGLWELILHMFTQKRTLGCDDNLLRWFEHFILVIGYLGLLFVTVFLNWFSNENLFVIILGYALSIIIFAVTTIFVTERIRKNKEISKYSQPSDWMFVVWLLLMGLTAFAVRLFIDLKLLENNIWLYLFHMIILVQWAIIIVPFGKWTHFLYRSFAMYFAKIKT